MRNRWKPTWGCAPFASMPCWLIVAISLFSVTESPFGRNVAWALEFGSLRASRPVIPAVDRRDIVALLRQQRVWTADKAAQQDAFNAWTRAEEQLDTARAIAWKAMSLPSARNVIVDEPLSLAALDLEIGV